MRISQISNTSFQAGNLNLKNISKKKLLCFDSLEKIAQDRNLRIYIAKAKDNEYLPADNLYTVLACSENNVNAASCALADKKNSINETSTKIFNAVFNAIELLEKKLTLCKTKS